MVTTIIPTIGRMTLYTRTIPSLLAQTVTDWHCIVVGDGIEVEPVEDPRIDFHTIPAPDYPGGQRERWMVGGAAAFNHGLDSATTEWVSYLADDDAYLPHHHARLLGASSDDLDVVYARSVTPDGNQYGRWPPERFNIVQGAYIMRRSVAPRASTDPGRYSWDARWWDDAIAADLRFAMVDDVVHRYHPQPQNVAFHGTGA